MRHLVPGPRVLAVALLLAGASSAAQSAPRPEAPTLVVSGEAQVGAEPDRAVVSLGATAQAGTAAAAQEQVNGSMQQVIAAVLALGIPERDVRTTGIYLRPVYADDSSRPGQEPPLGPRIVAYRAGNTVRVQVDDPAAVGGVIDAAVAAGANELEDISFELRDDTLQRAEALRRAVDNARHKASAIADAAGIRLLAVQRVEEGGIETFAPSLRMARGAVFEASAPVQPGQIRVSASVTLTYRIADGEAEGEGGGR